MYRHLPVTKKLNGKVRRYRNLAVFNRECGKRGFGGNICTLKNIRCLKDGGGLAVVSSEKGVIRGRPPGLWRLHFGSCEIMKWHLKGRVAEARAGMLGRL